MSIQTVAVPASISAPPRTQPEGHVKYCLKNCYNLGRVWVTAADACTWTPSSESIPVGEGNMLLFAVVLFPLGPAQLQLVIAGNRGGSGLINGYATLAANSGYDSGFLFTGGEGWESITTVTCVGGTANDLVDIYAVPDPDQFTDLAYVRSYEWTAGEHMMPVPDRFEPAATTVRLRRAPTFSFSKDYADPNAVDVIRSRETTILIEMHPSGLAGVLEYIYLPNAGVSGSINAPDNAMIIATAEGPSRPPIIYQPGL